MHLVNTDTVSIAQLLLDKECSAAAVELAATPWYRRHHVGLKEGYVHEGTSNDATAPHLGLEDELEEVLAEYTTDEELVELAALAQRHGCPCIGPIVREAIAAEVNPGLSALRTTLATERAAQALAGSRRAATERAAPKADERAALLDTA